MSAANSAQPSRRLLFIGVITVSLICIVTAVGFIRKSDNKVPSVSHRISPTSLQPITENDTNQAPTQLVRFTVYDAGIYPRQLRVQKGLTTVKIEDFSGGTAGLVFDRVNGNGRVPTGQVKRNGSHWRGEGVIRLQPGNYEVYSVEHPDNRSQLTVEP